MSGVDFARQYSTNKQKDTVHKSCTLNKISIYNFSHDNMINRHTAQNFMYIKYFIVRTNTQYDMGS